MSQSVRSLIDLVKAFPDEDACLTLLEKLRWNGSVVSPFESSSKVYACKNHKFKCKNTNRYFTVKTGTIFEDTKIPLVKWFMALNIFSSHREGITSHQLARNIDVTQKTGWFLLHRLRYAFSHPNFQAVMEGVEEVDNRHEDKNASSNQSHSTDNQIPAFSTFQN